MTTFRLLASLVLAFAFCAEAQFINGPVNINRLRNGDVVCSDGQTLRYNGTTGRWDACQNASGTAGGNYQTVENNGTAVTQRGALNLIFGTGVAGAFADSSSPSRSSITISLDAAVALTRATGQSGVDNTCLPNTGSGAAYGCSMAGIPLEGYTNGMRVMFRPDANCSGTPTLNINSQGAKNLYAADGTTAATCSAGLSYWLVHNAALNAGAGGWVFPATGGGTINTMTPSASGSDNFCAPTLTSWNPNGTFAFAESGDAAWPCSRAVTSSAFSAERGALHELAGPYVVPNAAGWDVQSVVQTGSSVAGVAFGFSLGRQAGATPTLCLPNSEQNCVGVIYSSSLGSNWRLRFCDASFVCTETDTGVAAVANTAYRLRLRSTVAGTLRASVNGSSEVTLATTLSLAVAPAWGVHNVAANARTFRVYWLGWDFSAAGKVLP